MTATTETRMIRVFRTNPDTGRIEAYMAPEDAALDDAPMPDELTETYPELTQPPPWLEEEPDRDDEPRPAPRLKTISAEDLLTRDWPEPHWIVPGLLPVGLALLAGRPKVGKSWLALQLAQAVAVGGRFFGEPIQQAPVLYLALEDSPQRIASRMAAQGWPIGRGRCDFMHSDGARELWPLGAATAQRLAQEIREQGYRLIVIDTLSRLYRGEQNRVDEAHQALGPLQAVAMELGATILLLDHHNKMQRVTGGEFSPVDDVLGSTGKAAVADVLLGLYRSEKGVTLAATGRDLEDRRLSLRWDRLTCCWQVVADDSQPEPLSAPRQEVLDALGGMGGGRCLDVAEALGKDKGGIHRLLQQMLSDGLVVQIGSTYHLPEQQPHQLGQPRQLGQPPVDAVDVVDVHPMSTAEDVRRAIAEWAR